MTKEEILERVKGAIEKTKKGKPVKGKESNIEDREKHLGSPEKTAKKICEKINIDHNAAIIAAKMHDKGCAYNHADNEKI